MRLIATLCVLFWIVTSVWLAHATEPERITLDIAESPTENFTPDPQLALYAQDFAAVENLFLGLTDYRPATQEIVPELARSWETSADGLTWTFHLRDDVYWVQYANETAEKMRRVVAGDFVYSIQRACAPNRDATGENHYYGTVLASIIAGCDQLNITPEADLTDALIHGEMVQVRAISDTVVEIQLQRPAAYFLALTAMPIMRPVPPELVHQYGDDWVQIGRMWSNGSYLLAENSEARRVLVENEFLPSELKHGGNIEQVNIHLIEDGGTIYALLLDNQLDRGSVPRSEIPIVVQIPENMQIIQVVQDGVFYFGLNQAKPPFDNVHVRRAFNAILDQQSLVEQVRGGYDLPIWQFTPTQLPLAPDLGEGAFDPIYAASELALAGYPNCAGFPPIDMITYQGAGIWAEYLAHQLEDELGCNPALFNIEQVEFSLLQAVISPDVPEVDRPHLWTLGWGSDYPDPHNWLFNVLYCEAQNPFRRPCSTVDDWLREAAAETDLSKRETLYEAIESQFFRPDGEFPILPISQRGTFMLFQNWFTGPHATDSFMGMTHWDAYWIDWQAKRAARKN